jgi:hypothetical protein
MLNCKNKKIKMVNVILSQNDEWQVISISQYTPQPRFEKNHHSPFFNIFCSSLWDHIKSTFFLGFQSGNPKIIKLWVPPIWELIKFSILIGKHPKKIL